ARNDHTLPRLITTPSPCRDLLANEERIALPPVGDVLDRDVVGDLLPHLEETPDLVSVLLHAHHLDANERLGALLLFADVVEEPDVLHETIEIGTNPHLFVGILGGAVHRDNDAIDSGVDQRFDALLREWNSVGVDLHLENAFRLGVAHQLIKTRVQPRLAAP